MCIRDRSKRRAVYGVGRKLDVVALCIGAIDAGRAIAGYRAGLVYRYAQLAVVQPGVYRQRTTCVVGKRKVSAALPVHNHGVIAAGPVSYTHLDVYKRQP